MAVVPPTCIAPATPVMTCACTRPPAPPQPAAVAVPAPHAFTATPPCLVPLVSGVRGPDPGRPTDIIITELDAAFRRTARRRGAAAFAWKTMLPLTLPKTSAAPSRSALDGPMTQQMTTTLVTVYSTARLRPGDFVASLDSVEYGGQHGFHRHAGVADTVAPSGFGAQTSALLVRESMGRYWRPRTPADVSLLLLPTRLPSETPAELPSVGPTLTPMAGVCVSGFLLPPRFADTHTTSGRIAGDAVGTRGPCGAESTGLGWTEWESVGNGGGGDTSCRTSWSRARTTSHHHPTLTPTPFLWPPASPVMFTIARFTSTTGSGSRTLTVTVIGTCCTLSCPLSSTSSVGVFATPGRLPWYRPGDVPGGAPMCV